MPLIVRGEIVFAEDARAFSGATVSVRLEDVSRVDAAARIVAEQEIVDVRHAPASAAPIPFTLAVHEVVDERATYAVRVHVDVDGDRRVGRGDFVSTASHPVLTFGRPAWASVPVREVT
jgi:uncharacterized lipoprotein YbaY